MRSPTIASDPDLPLFEEGVERVGERLGLVKHDRYLAEFDFRYSNRRFDKNYPWADTLSGVEGIIRARQGNKKSALPLALVKEIIRQAPHGTGPGFAGGDDLIRDIAQMANDKHSIGFAVIPSMIGMTLRDMMFSGSGSLLTPWDPVKKEMILARLQPGSSFSYENCTVSACIFFDRAGNIGKVPALAAVRLFAECSQSALEGFKGACAKINARGL